MRKHGEMYYFFCTNKKQLGNGKTITYKLKFIDSFRFMSTSLSSLVNNISDGLYNDKCTDCKSCLEYVSAKDNQLIFNCLKCNSNYNKEFNEDSIKRFASTYEFCDKDINEFLLFLKGVYPYEYINTWKNFDETTLPNKEDFYSSLIMEKITDVDYMHAKKYLKSLMIKILVIIMIYIFKVIHYYLLMYLRILEINTLKYMKLILLLFLSAPGLAWEA